MSLVSQCHEQTLSESRSQRNFVIRGILRLHKETIPSCQINILKNLSGFYAILATSDEVLSVYVVLQWDEKNNSAKHNDMIFDYLDLSECWRMENIVRTSFKN